MDTCGKGKLPKCTDSHGPEAGSDAEQAQNCHIGNYMEGYLTQERYKVSTAASKPLMLPFLILLPYGPHDLERTKYKKRCEVNELRASTDSDGDPF